MESKIKKYGFVNNINNLPHIDFIKLSQSLQQFNKYEHEFIIYQKNHS